MKYLRTTCEEVRDLKYVLTLLQVLRENVHYLTCRCLDKYVVHCLESSTWCPEYFENLYLKYLRYLEQVYTSQTPCRFRIRVEKLKLKLITVPHLRAHVVLELRYRSWNLKQTLEIMVRYPYRLGPVLRAGEELVNWFLLRKDIWFTAPVPEWIIGYATSNVVRSCVVKYVEKVAEKYNVTCVLRELRGKLHLAEYVVESNSSSRATYTGTITFTVATSDPRGRGLLYSELPPLITQHRIRVVVVLYFRSWLPHHIPREISVHYP